MANVFDVAYYILKKNGASSHMKLQKLVYYSQAWSLVWDEKPLFDEPVQAWANGPVIPALFAHLKGKFTVSASDLDANLSVNGLSEAEQETINLVLDFYANRDAQWLSDLTHLESPWANARINIPAGERGSREITLDQMAEYYSSL